MKNYSQLKKELLKNKGIRSGYDDLEQEYALVQSLIEARLKKGLTQRELADKIGTKQSAISRLESGTYNPSLVFLRSVAAALDSNLKVSLA